MSCEASASLTLPGDELNIYGSVMHVACLGNQVQSLKFLLYNTAILDKDFDV